MKATSPKELKASHPWLSLSQLQALTSGAGKISGPQGIADAKSLSGAGQALPPYHLQCRCTVDISTDFMTFESLIPWVAPSPKRPAAIMRQPTTARWIDSMMKEEDLTPGM